VQIFGNQAGQADLIKGAALDITFAPFTSRKALDRTT
jgi:hypothetical protein